MRVSNRLIFGAAISIASIAMTGCQDEQGVMPATANAGTAIANDGSNVSEQHDSISSTQTNHDMGKFNIQKESFGKMPDGRAVSLFTVTNPNGVQLKMTNYGAAVVSLEVPDKNGKLANVTLGLPTLDGYLKHTTFFGATIGRYGNRIAKGKFTLGGQEYSLPINNQPNHLHGGPNGFDHQVWTVKEVEKPDAAGLEFTYVSKDGEAGYPGTLTTTVEYWLTKDNELKIDYAATTDKDTVLNLTNHTYWNLAGAGSGTVLDQQVMIAADKYLAVDDTLIPTGKMADVKGSPFDLTSSKQIGPGVAEITKQGGNGYDHCFVLRSQDGKLALAAKAKDPASGRVMEVWTDQPGIQFYTGNFLDGSPTSGGFPQHAAFCLETQHYPDSPNRPEFPSTVLKPGQTFKSTTIYKFSTG
jgi:aldose 1-epimerase